MYIYLAISFSYDIFYTLLTEAKTISRGVQPCRFFLKKLTQLARNLFLKICANLIVFLKQIIHSKDFSDRHRRSSKDFTRERLLPFPTLIFFLINLLKGSVQDELDYFFKALRDKDVAERFVTKSAFTKARKKLCHQAFIELSRKMISFFYDSFPYRKWRGFRLLTIDGSTVRLPRSKEITENFGGGNCPLARISHLHDALNGVIVDALIRSMNQGERILAAEHVKQVKSGDLLLLDRWYPAFWLFALVLSKGIHFCARIQEAHWNEIRKFYLSGKQEQILSLRPSSVSIEMCDKLGLPVDPLQVRAIRVELGNGKTEILVTSLMDSNLYPHEIFKDLYKLRWTAEENYKAVKCRIEIENFSGKSVESVYQDFHAKVFAMNLTTALIHPAQAIVDTEMEPKKHSYKVNLTQALSKMKDSIFLLFQHSNILGFLHKLFELFVNTIEPVRPGRNFQRKHKTKISFHNCYKPIR